METECGGIMSQHAACSIALMVKGVTQPSGFLWNLSFIKKKSILHNVSDSANLLRSRCELHAK